MAGDQILFLKHILTLPNVVKKLLQFQ